MATTKNAGSIFLAAANPRLLTAPNSNIILSTTSPVFHVNSSGTPDTTSIIITATLISLVGTVTFSCTGGTLSSISGNTAVLPYANMSANTAAITATLVYRGNTFTSNTYISKVIDTVGTAGLNNAIAYAYKRSASAPADNPGAVTYDFTTASISTTTLANGWTKTIPAGTSPLYVVAASASNIGSTDPIAGSEWSTPVALASNGIDGLSVATAFIYQRTTTNVAPSLPSVSAVFTFATGALTGLNNGWTPSVPDAVGGKYLWVSTATAAATTATDTLLSSEWAAVNLMAQDGVAGGNNAIAYAYQRSATAPTLSPGAVTYDFPSASITTATLLNGWLKAIPAGTDPLYVATASASNVASTDAIAANEWSGAVKLAQDGTNGINGLSVATVFIYQRTVTNVAPALPSASTTYTFATGVLTGLNNGWTTAVPASGGATYLWVSTATAANTTATDTLASSEWAAAQVMAQDGAAGGARGAGHYYATGTWTDAAADAATPGANVIDDVVTISNGTSVSEKKWTGTAWVDNGLVIDGNAIVNGSVIAAKINANGLTIRKADGTIILDAGGGGLQAGFEAPGTLNSSIKLGGRNFILDSQHLVDAPNNTGLGTSALMSDESTPYYRITAITSVSTFNSVYLFPKIPIGTQCVISSDVRVTSAGSVGFYSGQGMQAVPANVWTRISFVFTYDGTARQTGHTYAGTVLDYRNYKVEIGNIATDWTPAPEDVAADIALAQAAADTANTALGVIANDNVLSKGEKSELLLKWNAIDAERVPLKAQADALSVSWTVYDTAYTNLGGYLVGLGPSSEWANTTVDTTIVGADFRTAFSNYYTAKINLLNAIAAKSATLANWSNIVGQTNAPANNATVGATIGTNLSGQMTAANISTYIAGAAIDIALIKTASIGSLSALSAELGSAVISTTGSLRSGQTAYNTGTGFWIGLVSGTPKFSIGNPAGAYMTWDGSSLVQNGVTQNSPILPTLTLSGTFDYTASGANSSPLSASLSASGSNGRAPYTYSWAVNKTSSGPSSGPALTVSSLSGSSISVTCSAGTNQVVTASVTCTMTDSNGQSRTTNGELSYTFGTPP